MCNIKFSKIVLYLFLIISHVLYLVTFRTILTLSDKTITLHIFDIYLAAKTYFIYQYEGKNIDLNNAE